MVMRLCVDYLFTSCMLKTSLETPRNNDGIGPALSPQLPYPGRRTDPNLIG